MLLCQDCKNIKAAIISNDVATLHRFYNEAEYIKDICTNDKLIFEKDDKIYVRVRYHHHGDYYAKCYMIDKSHIHKLKWNEYKFE